MWLLVLGWDPAKQRAGADVPAADSRVKFESSSGRSGLTRRIRWRIYKTRRRCEQRRQAALWIATRHRRDHRSCRSVQLVRWIEMLALWI